MEIDETSISTEEQREVVEGAVEALARVMPGGVVGNKIQTVMAGHGNEPRVEVELDGENPPSLGNAYGRALIGEGYAVIGVHPSSYIEGRSSDADTLVLVELESVPGIVSNKDDPYSHIFMPSDETVRERLTDAGINDLAVVVDEVIEEYPGLVNDYREGDRVPKEYLVDEIWGRVDGDVSRRECDSELDRQL